MSGVTNGGHRYIRTPSGQPIGIDDGTDTYWLLADRLGSITGITDPNGVEVVDYTYAPFGEVTTTGTDPIGGQPLGFASGYTDRTTGLINYGQRWYDPTTATWTQPDPAGTPDWSCPDLMDTGCCESGIPWRRRRAFGGRPGLGGRRGVSMNSGLLQVPGTSLDDPSGPLRLEHAEPGCPTSVANSR